MYSILPNERDLRTLDSIASCKSLHLEGLTLADVACNHLDQITDAAPSADGCEDCLAIGGQWLHLRRCTACGHIGCCDSSPNRHASAHVSTHNHPIVQSFEPGEDWLWCFVDEVAFELPSMTPSPSHS